MDIAQAHNLSGSSFVAFKRCIEMRPLPNGKIEWPTAPAIVCAAFSVEIGFKAIILEEGGRGSSHELFELFKKMSSAAQNLIVKEVGFDRTAFSVELYKVSQAFAEWRYVYEKKSAQVNIDFLSKLAGATQQASAASRPK
jgi:hypothetical protein